jgi:type VI secretion system protein ImpH
VSNRTIEQHLYEEGYAFDFFQAVRLLRRLAPERCSVGLSGPPTKEIVRFRAHPSLAFPASSVYEILRAERDRPPLLTVTFLGLTGPSGVLPRHYTEMLLRLDRDLKGPEKHALRDFFDLFNHRLVSLFFRAWEKYRFWVAFERSAARRDEEASAAEPDLFPFAVFSLIGLGTAGLRGRLRVASRSPPGRNGTRMNADWADSRGSEKDSSLIRENLLNPRSSAFYFFGAGRPEKVLARIEDLVLVYYSGLLAQRHRNAAGLAALVGDYFNLPVRVVQFRGQWLRLPPADCSRLGSRGANNELGINLVVGERVWDVQSKFRVRLGPLSYARFLLFLPDRSAETGQGAFFLLVYLVRLYVGAELDFDVQLVLEGEEVPECQLPPARGEVDTGRSPPRLGWNTWLISSPPPAPVGDPVFEGQEVD